MVIVPLFSAVVAEISIGCFPASHASPCNFLCALPGFSCQRLLHALFHHRTGNNILRCFGGKPALANLHGHPRPVVYPVKNCLCQSLAMETVTGPNVRVLCNVSS